MWFDDRKDLKNPNFGFWLWLREVENDAALTPAQRQQALDNEAQLCTFASARQAAGDIHGDPPQLRRFRTASRPAANIYTSSGLSCNLGAC